MNRSKNITPVSLLQLNIVSVREVMILQILPASKKDLTEQTRPAFLTPELQFAAKTVL